jgi:hypothetical protein
VEDAYWRDNYRSRPYVRGEDTSSDLERGWDKAKVKSKLGWIEAKDAVRDGWNRVERAVPGDADRDGR